jgi:hypothetical protein
MQVSSADAAQDYAESLWAKRAARAERPAMAFSFNGIRD